MKLDDNKEMVAMLDHAKGSLENKIRQAYNSGYNDGYKAKEYDRDGDCEGCKFIGIAHRCEGCCRNYADGYVAMETKQTKEDAIYYIKNLAVLSNEKDMPQIEEALNMAIKALEQAEQAKPICEKCEHYGHKVKRCLLNKCKYE